jgi:hypothetical protein
MAIDTKVTLSGFFVLCVLITLIATVWADDSLPFPVYMQGNQSTLVELSNGTYSLETNGVIPYVSISGTDITQIYFLDIITVLQKVVPPFQAEIALFKNNQWTRSLVSIHTITYDPVNHTLEAELVPVEYYEGSMFTNITQDIVGIKPGTYQKSGILCEVRTSSPQNGKYMCGDQPCGCGGQPCDCFDHDDLPWC